MDQTARISLPFVLPNQAQKHVTLNESLSRLDLLVQPVIVSRTTGAEPDTPAEGSIWVVPEGATGSSWTGQPSGTLAAWQDDAWVFVQPAEGWRTHVLNEGIEIVWSGSEWTAAEGASTSRPMLGINTTPDETHRFAVKADAELLSHDDITPGSGNARKIINKAGETDTASVLFQSGWQGRAEFGLVGDNAFTLKISDNGVTFREALRFDPATGAARVAGGFVHPASGMALSNIIPIAGGDGVVSAYRCNPAREPNPRTAIISAVTGDTLTLSAAIADQFFNDEVMSGVSMVRIWNTTLIPAEPAWVKASPTDTSLTVLDAASVANWQSGHAIQIGDPTSITSGRVIAIDISPMLIAVFGTAFRQTGVLARTAALATGGIESGIDVSPDGAGGSFLSTRGYAGQHSATSQFILATPVPSPVSESNLIYVRENTFDTHVGTAFVSIVGVLV